MCPSVDEPGPGSCPHCGMALESSSPVLATTKTEWTCPMHPVVVRDEPGDCPKCGMALEPTIVSIEQPADPELADMSRRFWFAA